VSGEWLEVREKDRKFLFLSAQKTVHVIQLSAEFRCCLPQDALKGATESVVAAGATSEKDKTLLVRVVHHWFRVY
jgi:hypothetical protein